MGKDFPVHLTHIPFQIQYSRSVYVLDLSQWRAERLLLVKLEQVKTTNSAGVLQTNTTQHEAGSQVKQHLHVFSA